MKRWKSWGILLSVLFAAGVALGAVIAVSKASRHHAAARAQPNTTPTPSNALDYRMRLFPDASIDVCVWTFRGATLPPVSAMLPSLKGVDDMATGRVLGLDQVGERIVPGCPGQPPTDPVAVRPDRKPDQTELVFRPHGPALAAGEVPAFDLRVFVYPQTAADAVGKAWSDRAVAYQFRTDGDVTVQVATAVLIGDQEVLDPVLLKRLLGWGRWLAGSGNALRPYITGECIDPGNPACGPEIGE